MEQFIVSARKYRPATWSQVIGQESITDTLQRSIDSNHLAQAYLFCGPRGVGKTTCARIFAKAINVVEGEKDSDYAFNIFELDAASHNSVDDIRSLIEQVRVPPQTGKYKVYIIDEVHMLSSAAFNSFLKTLEEPPAYAIFILATTEKHKILPTILSRCQIYDFKRIQVKDIVQALRAIAEKEKIRCEDEALHIIADKADGALRDALSIFDQLVSFTSGNLTEEKVRESLNVLDREYYFRFVDHFQAHDIGSSLLLLNEVVSNGFDPQHFLEGLSQHLRDLLVAKDENTIDLLQVSDSILTRYRNQAKQCTPGWIVSSLGILQKADAQYKQSRNPRLLSEVCLMQLATDSAIAEQKKNHVTPDTQQSQPKEQATAPATSASVIESKIHQLPPEKTVPEKPVIPEPNPISSDAMPKDAYKAPQSATTEVSEPGPAKEPEKRSPSTLSKPKQGLGASAFSISGALNKKVDKKEDTESPNLEDMPRSAFSKEQLLTIWTAYAETLKEEGNLSIFTMLTKRAPLVEGEILTLELDNAVQEHYLDEIRQELLDYMRKKLNNFGIQLEARVTESDDQPEVYTPMEQFRKMAEKNPKLIDLKNRLDLDIDF